MQQCKPDLNVGILLEVTQQQGKISTAASILSRGCFFVITVVQSCREIAGVKAKGKAISENAQINR